MVFEAARDESYFERRMETIGNFKKLQMRMQNVCAYIQRTRPSHSINMINILCKQKLSGYIFSKST